MISWLDRAATDTHGLRDLRRALPRALAAALATLLLYSLAGWPSNAAGAWLGIAVLVLSYLASAGIEFGWNYLLAPGRIAEEEVQRLREANSELARKAALVDQKEQHIELLNQKIEQLERAYAVSQAQYKVLDNFQRPGS